MMEALKAYFGKGRFISNESFYQFMKGSFLFGYQTSPVFLTIANRRFGEKLR